MAEQKSRTAPGGALNVAASGGAPRPIEVRKQERELFFWTVEEALRAVRKTLLVVVLIALTVYLVVSLAEGELRDGDVLLRYLSSGAGQ